MIGARPAGGLQLLLHLGQLLAGLVQVQPQHHQTHAEQGWQQPGAGRPLRPG